MSQLDFDFSARSAFQTLRDIIAMIDPAEAEHVSELMQSEFKSAHYVIGASFNQLSELSGPKTARLLCLVEQFTRQLAHEKIMENREVLSNWTALTDDLRALLCGVQIEKFLCLYLDKKNRLIRIVENTGTIDRCPVYPREIMRNALMLNATALILVHNHPSGDPSPSQSDIDMTKKIVNCASAFSIAVHDHVIIGDGDITSFKSLGLM